MKVVFTRSIGRKHAADLGLKDAPQEGEEAQIQDVLAEKLAKDGLIEIVAPAKKPDIQAAK